MITTPAVDSVGTVMMVLGSASFEIVLEQKGGGGFDVAITISSTRLQYTWVNLSRRVDMWNFL
jgi:hypothetical protein